MAFTPNEPEANSGTVHSVEVEINQEEQQILTLPNLPGDDYLEHKGDLWKLSFSDFGFSDTCITIEEISRVSIIASGIDNWIIESIVTFVLYSNGGSQVLTQDFDVYRLIDVNSADISDRQFDLTFA